MSWDESADYQTDLDIPSGKFGKLIAVPGGPGPSGPPGPQGEPGPAGPPGPAEGVEFTENKGVPDGYAPLGSDGNVPAENLPDVYAADVVDSTLVGQALVTAPDEAAARAAIGLGDAPYVPKAAPAVGDAVADTAAIDAALMANSFVRADDGTYVVPAAGVTVPAGKSLLVGEGAAIKLADGQVAGAAGLFTAVQLGDGATFIGAVDGNRAGQDRASYNAGPGSANWLVAAVGTAALPLTGLHIDAQISNAVNNPLRLDYVNDSYVRVRAKDCGGAINFTNCDNLTVDIEVDGTDNAGWKIWQHAVDFGNCTRIRGRVVIRDQAGDGTPAEGTGLSPWNSGLTMVECSDITFDEVDVEFTEKPNQSKGLGVSLLGVRNIHVGRLRSVGFSDCLVEIGGVVDGTFNGLELDGRYAVGKAGNTGSGVGINIYNNGTLDDMSGTTLQHPRNLKFIGGSIRRCLSNGINMKASKDTSWYGVEVSGCLIGLSAVAGDQQTGSGVAPSAGGNVPKGHRFIGCDFVFNERSGVDIQDMTDSAFHGCRANNNSQAMTFGSTRNGLTPDGGTAGFRTKTGTSKTGLVWSGDSQADDVQGTTGPGFLNPARPTVVAVDRPERYGVGQTLTISGAGAGGADLLTRVNGIRHDELTLQHPAGTFPTATLTGTIATSGTAVTGTGTKFLTELVGRAWVKVGAEYRRIAKVTSDTAAVLASAFPANVPAGTALVIVRANIVTAPSQNYGYSFSADTVEPVIASNRVPTGNVTAGLNDQSSGGYRTLFAPVIANNMVVRGIGATPPEIVSAGPNANTSLVLKSQGAGSLWVRDGSNNSILQVAPVGGVTNCLQITSQPAINAVSTNADANITITPKGAGFLTIYVAAGQTPRLQGAGADTNHNLSLAAKGTGVVQIASAAGTPLGQVETKGHTHVAADITGAAQWITTPAASATAPGTPGQLCHSGGFLYCCVAVNTWVWVKTSNTWPPA